MTNLELAQQQGNQAAPNLLAAATAGELGGGGSVFPSLKTAGFVTTYLPFRLDSDQADEAAANTIYANCKLVTDNHLDVFMLVEEYKADIVEYSGASHYFYLAFSARILTHIKNAAALMPEMPEVLEIFDNIEPDELCTFEAEIADDILAIVREIVSLGVDELPPIASGVITLSFEPADFDLIPEGSSVYFLKTYPAGYSGSGSNESTLAMFSYYAESVLDAPAKFDKTYYVLGK